MSYKQEPVQIKTGRLVTLSIKQLEESLICLYKDQPPKNKKLKGLRPDEWQALALLLGRLMSEREQARIQ